MKLSRCFLWPCAAGRGTIPVLIGVTGVPNQIVVHIRLQREQNMLFIPGPVCTECSREGRPGPSSLGLRIISLESGQCKTAKGHHHIGVGTMQNFQKSFQNIRLHGWAAYTPDELIRKGAGAARWQVGTRSPGTVGRDPAIGTGTRHTGLALLLQFGIEPE